MLRITPTDHGVEGEGNHDTDGDTLRSRACIEDLRWDDPRKRSTSSREADIVEPGDGNKAPARRVIDVRRGRWENTKQDCSDDECKTVSKVSEDEWPSTASVIDEEDTAQLREKCKHAADSLVLESGCCADANLRVDRLGLLSTTE